MTVSPSVTEVILNRRRTRSRPGARTDGHRVALAIEGGGNRSAYSAGMCIALDELGLLDSFDAVYGTSGGALNGAWLLTGEAQRWLPSWGWDEVAAARVTDPGRVLRGRPVLDLRILVDHVYELITPMKFEHILANPITFHPVATEARTGAATDLAGEITDVATLKTALQASASLPLLAGGPVRLGADSYVDGGLSAAVPLAPAFSAGATHVLALRTRSAGQMPGGSLLERAILTPYFARHAPGAGRSYARRHRDYERYDSDAWDEAQQLTQIRPVTAGVSVARLGRDLGPVRRAIELGHEAVLAAFPNIGTT